MNLATGSHQQLSAGRGHQDERRAVCAGNNGSFYGTEEVS